MPVLEETRVDGGDEPFQGQRSEGNENEKGKDLHYEESSRRKWSTAGSVSTAREERAEGGRADTDSKRDRSSVHGTVNEPSSLRLTNGSSAELGEAEEDADDEAAPFLCIVPNSPPGAQRTAAA